MSVLQKFLPTPSDRMGIIWTLCGLDEGIVLEYGPSGTTHYAVETQTKMEAAEDNNLFCTHITEDDVIMGDTTKLEEAILEIDKKRKPKYIFVVGSSVTAIIAADLEGVKFLLQDKINAKIITYSHGCFVGDYSLGIRDALTSLSEIIKEPTTCEKSGYNIIGAIGDNYRNSSDINAIKELMKESFDIDPIAIFPKTSITDIENCGNAKVNLVLRTEGLALAKHMKEKYGVPYIDGCPYGYAGTKNWLTKISEEINIPINKEVVSRLDEKITDCTIYRMYGIMYKITLSAKIFANYDVCNGVGDFLKNELFFNDVEKYASHSLSHLENINEDVVSLTEESKKKEILKEANDIFLLSDDETFTLANDSVTKMRIATPVTKWKPIATHMPFMTEKGADYILEYVEFYLKELVKKREYK